MMDALRYECWPITRRSNLRMGSVLLKIVRLFRAAAGEILGIKIQNHPLTAEVAEANGLAILSVQCEFWRRRASGRCSCCVARGASRHKSHQQEDRNDNSNRNGQHF